MKPAVASSPLDAACEAIYDRFAPAYRDWWAPVIALAAVRLLDQLDGLVADEAPATLVDIGAGTGTLALAALRRWPRVRVIGIDPARRLLEMAGAEGRAAGLGARLTVAVDGAMSSFVFQLVPNRVAAVREAFRVVRPGSVFACLTWRTDPHMFEPRDVLDDVLDDLGVTPPQPGSGRERSYRSSASAAAELRRAGFRSVHAREEWLEHRYTARSYVDMAEHWIVDETFASLDEPMRRHLRDELLPPRAPGCRVARVAAPARQRRRPPFGLNGPGLAGPCVMRRSDRR